MAQMVDPPPYFPHLPHDTSYPANILAAHDVISGIYQHVLQILAHEDADPLRLSFHCNAITSDALPLLEAIGEDSGVTGCSSRDWVVGASIALASVAARLQDYCAGLSNRYIPNI